VVIKIVSNQLAQQHQLKDNLVQLTLVVVEVVVEVTVELQLVQVQVVQV